MANAADLKLSDSYRSARRSTTVFCGVGLAWSAAQFEIKFIDLDGIGQIVIDTASIPILLGIMCIYSMVRTTIEYLMQSLDVRRWPLAQIDYSLTYYLLKFTIVVLTASAIARSWVMVAYIALAFLIGLAGFFLLVFLLMAIWMPIRMFIRKGGGVAAGANEALAYSILTAAGIYLLVFILIGLQIINPFLLLGESFTEISPLQIGVFSFVCTLVLVTFFYESRYLDKLFSTIPRFIESRMRRGGSEYVTIEPNPEHPEYENRDKESSIIISGKIDKN